MFSPFHVPKPNPLTLPLILAGPYSHRFPCRPHLERAFCCGATPPPAASSPPRAPTTTLAQTQSFKRPEVTAPLKAFMRHYAHTCRAAPSWRRGTAPGRCVGAVGCHHSPFALVMAPGAPSSGSRLTKSFPFVVLAPRCRIRLMRPEQASKPRPVCAGASVEPIASAAWIGTQIGGVS